MAQARKNSKVTVASRKAVEGLPPVSRERVVEAFGPFETPDLLRVLAGVVEILKGRHVRMSAKLAAVDCV
jgi:hypothetical protein